MSTSGKASETFIPPHGGYAGLLAYQKALIVCQGTVRFCERFLPKRDRTIDQMVRAVRSGKQNIVEASQASGTSKEAEMEDYRDFPRMQKIMLWAKDSQGSLVCAQACGKGKYVL